MAFDDWDSVVDELGPRLYRYFKFKGAERSASDLTQETFIRLVQKRHSFDSTRGPLIAFALGIAKNVWLESLRSRETESLDENYDIASDHDLHAQLESLDQSEKIKAVIARLPKIQQEILYFFFDEEITTREISNVLEIPEGTVKSHLHRAKESLRITLAKEWS